MARYVWQWDYRSAYGAGEAGAEADLDERLAEAINRDSPGVLVPADEQTRAVESPPNHRQVTGARNRKTTRTGGR